MTDEEFFAEVEAVDRRCAELVEMIDALDDLTRVDEMFEADNGQCLLSELRWACYAKHLVNLPHIPHRLAVLDPIWHWYDDLNQAWLRWEYQRKPPLLAELSAADSRALWARVAARIT